MELRKFDGAERLKRKSEAIDFLCGTGTSVIEPPPIPKPRYDTTPESNTSSPIESVTMIPTYSIFKRSLPVGLNIEVAWNITHEAALKALKCLKSREERTDTGDRVIYYDVVRTGSIEEDDVFFNPRPFIIEGENDQTA